MKIYNEINERGSTITMKILSKVFGLKELILSSGFDHNSLLLNFTLTDEIDLLTRLRDHFKKHKCVFEI